MKEVKVQGFKVACFGVSKDNRYDNICKQCNLFKRKRRFVGQENYWRMEGIAKDGQCPIKDLLCK